MDFYNNSNWQSISDRAYNIYKKLVESNKLYLLSPQDIEKVTKYLRKFEAKKTLEELIVKNNMYDLNVNDYKDSKYFKLKQDIIDKLHILEPSVNIIETPLFARFNFSNNNGGIEKSGEYLALRTTPNNDQQDTWIWMDNVIRFAPDTNMCVTYVVESPSQNISVNLAKLQKCEKNNNSQKFKTNIYFFGGKTHIESFVTSGSYTRCLSYGVNKEIPDSEIGLWECISTYEYSQALNNNPEISYEPFKYLSNDAIRVIARISLSIHK